MTIYVDNAAVPYKRSLYCHLLTDGDLSELHEFARRLGIRKCWFHNRRGVFPHYDVKTDLRPLAIELGAIAAPSREILERCRRAK